MRGLRAAALAALLLLAGCTATAEGGPTPDSLQRSGPVQSAAQPCPAQPDTPATGGDQLPALRFDCLGGGTLNLGRAPGVPAVVNLWASWCGPCRDELPLMQQLADAAGGKVAVVGVVSKDGLDQATAFAADAGATFPSAFDGDGELMTQLGLNGLPYTYFLDARGAVAYTQVGPVHSLDELEGLVADHLGVQL